LERSGIYKIVVVANPKDVDLFARFFETNKRAVTEIFYTVQDIPLGTANAIKLGRKYITESSFFSLWGDNVFEFNLESSIGKPLSGQSRLHLARVNNPQDFGVVEIDTQGNVLSIEDKPQNPKSNVVCTGFMGFKSEVFEMVDKIQPNEKGEYDIMDIIRKVNSQKMLEYSFIKGCWLDAGVSFDTLLAASSLAKMKGLNK
jgi:glucose-1-phosphate thymidylyltransferase